MNQKNQRSDWNRPIGIPPGNWEYVNDSAIALGYDHSLRQSPLVTIDQQIIDQHLPNLQTGLAIDFGCGTGRNAIPLLNKDWQVMGIDLSCQMLMQFAAKLQPNHRAILLQANLLELSCVANDIADFGQCMFSTFGMLQGKSMRQTFLKHALRILRKDTPFIIHAHNYWHHLRIRGGIKWLLKNTLAARLGKCERGDRYADYRSVNQMMLHHFSFKSFCDELRVAGFQVETSYAVLPNETYTDKPRDGRLGKAIGWFWFAEARFHSRTPLRHMKCSEACSSWTIAFIHATCHHQRLRPRKFRRKPLREPVISQSRSLVLPNFPIG